MMQKEISEQKVISRILVINPNTNTQITNRIRALGNAIISPGTSLYVTNPVRGPFGIETAAERAAAEPNVIEMIQEGENAGYDAFVLACFDDIGLDAARKLVSCPVVGTFEAGIGVARTLAQRFSIVTTYTGAIKTIDKLIDQYGVSDIAKVRAAGISVADASNPNNGNDDLAEAFEQSINIDKAEAILLGSGGLTGRATSLSTQFRIPVIDGTAAAIKLAESALLVSGNYQAD